MNKNIVTKVEFQKKSKDRVNVYIDGEFAFSCSIELVYSHNIKKDKILDIDYIKGIVNQDNYIKAKKYALNIVEKGYKTEKGKEFVWITYS
jgi:regulatory protein